MTDSGLFVEGVEIRITKEDVEILSEDQLKALREHNRLCMTKDYQQSALQLPTGIPKNCKVEQPGDQIRPDYDGKQGSLCWRAGGDVRICSRNGINRKEYQIGFAGAARKQSEMNNGETTLTQNDN